MLQEQEEFQNLLLKNKKTINIFIIKQPIYEV